MKHSAHFSSSGLHLKSLTYDLTDEHTCGNPYWSWAYDFSSAVASFPCTDKRCHHRESVQAAVTGEKVLALSTSTEDEAQNKQTEKLQNAVKALYWYRQAACSYFN